MVQRDPIFEAATAAEPGTKPMLSPDELRKLNVDVLTELRRLAGNAVTRANEEFHRGCDAVSGELAKAAKLKAEMIALVLDVAVGFAAPALAAPLLAETALRRGASAALAGKSGPEWAIQFDEIVSKARSNQLQLSPRFYDQISGDNLKATFTGIGKAGYYSVKNFGPEMLTGDSKKIVTELQALSSRGSQDLDRSVGTLNEGQLVALITALDVSVANQSSYAAAIRQYLDQVVAIGALTGGNESGMGQKKLVRIDAWGRSRLAIVDSGTTVYLGLVGVAQNYFLTWVGPQMAASALERAGVPQDPGEVAKGVYHAGAVPKMDPGSVSNLTVPTAATSVSVVD